MNVSTLIFGFFVYHKRPFQCEQAFQLRDNACLLFMASFKLADGLRLIMVTYLTVTAGEK